MPKHQINMITLSLISIEVIIVPPYQMPVIEAK